MTNENDGGLTPEEEVEVLGDAGANCLNTLFVVSESTAKKCDKPFFEVLDNLSRLIKNVTDEIIREYKRECERDKP